MSYFFIKKRAGLGYLDTCQDILKFYCLKPLGEEAASGNAEPLEEELSRLTHRPDSSRLAEWLPDDDSTERARLVRNALSVPCLAERALAYLFAEQNLISEVLMRRLVRRLQLDTEFLSRRLADNRRPVDFSQEELWSS